MKILQIYAVYKKYIYRNISFKLNFIKNTDELIKLIPGIGHVIFVKSLTVIKLFPESFITFGN